MKTRQAIIVLVLYSLLTGLFACTPSKQENVDPSTPSPVVSITPTLPPSQTPTPTPLGCLSQPGEVRDGKINATNPAQEFKIYLPPCYDVFTDKHYPVLYLLHGLTYTDDQWTRLGAATQADKLIHSGEAPPFIIVFPDNRYWNLPAGPGFSTRFIELVVPYIDQNYRTLTDRKHRALGGLSLGGGQTIRLGFQHWDKFGMLGLHSPAILVDDAEFIWRWLDAIPRESFPRLWIDVGAQDAELSNTRLLEDLLTQRSLPHEFHFYQGAHVEDYWSAHVDQYIKWYAESWSDLPTQ